MKISYNLMQKMIGSKLPPVDELIEKINSQLGGVEETIDLRKKYQDALIVKVVSCEKHPNADRLSVCLIDDGQVSENVSRNEDGLVTVVCGAPNVRAGIFAIWLPPKSVVPSTFSDLEPFVLDTRKLRGVMSNGMLAAGDELDLNSDHTGIIEISESDIPTGQKLEPGASFAKTYGLDDVVIDIENKMFTHRPDLFGQLGVAREIFAILNNDVADEYDAELGFLAPKEYRIKHNIQVDDDFKIEAEIEDPDKISKLMVVPVAGIKIDQSPLWFQTELVRLGMKPVNNVVDITNYVMLMTSQPVHAYDLDKISGKKLVARAAKSDEKVTLLNDKQYELLESDIVIADQEKVLGLGGVMGGKDSEVSDGTKNILLEVASFDMYAIRKTSMQHGLFTDAVTRFSKGQSPLQLESVMQFLLELIQKLTSPDKIGQTTFSQNESVGRDNAPIEITADFVNSRLGLNLSEGKIRNLLALTNIKTEISDSKIFVYPPFWRTDLELKEDIVEEVGRIYGFDLIPRALPKRTILPAQKNHFLEHKQQIRQIAKSFGANEVLTYSFINEKVVKNADQNSEHAFRISNALSPDLQFYRLSVLPSLLSKVHAEIKAGHDEFLLYEFGKGHNKNLFGEDDLPAELNLLDGVYAAKHSHDGAPFYQVRTFIDKLFKQFNLSARFSKIQDQTEFEKSDLYSVFEPNRSAEIVLEGGESIGVVGEFKLNVKKALKLPDCSAGFSIDMDQLSASLKAALDNPAYQPLSKYPSLNRDVSLTVSKQTEYQQVLHSVEDSAQKFNYDIQLAPVSIYTESQESDKKTITFSVKITDYDKTLSSQDAQKVIEAIENSFK